MKIIDKRKDYYDYACQYSDTPLWVRKEQSINLEAELTRNQVMYLEDAYSKLPKTSSAGLRSGTFKSVIFGYCGTVIPLFLVYIGDYKPEVKTYTNIDDAIKEWNDVYANKTNQEIKSRNFYFSQYNFSYSGVLNWKSEFNNPTNLTDIFIALKSPIWIMDKDGLTINPHLKSYGIQRVLNPFTVYQDTERYVGNELVMCNQKTPDFGDELKRDAHGMDNWSFKTRKNTKKRKQK